ncbi:MAG: hypothetical protein WBX00_26685 [Isosphaeraceae bacterium]
MEVFTVTKPGGTKDHEFEEFTRLLEDIGVDVANVPRVPEPGTGRRWLYTWRRKEEAEGFARELKNRTRDGTWHVYEFKTEDESRGPVAPLDIYQVRAGEGRGYMYYLTPASLERIIRAYPHSKLYPSVTISEADLDNIRKQHGDIWWNQVCILLTGLSKTQVRSLGGYRVILPDGEIGYEELPEIPA